MENKREEGIEELIYRIKDLIQLKFQISTLKITDKAASLTGLLVSGLVVAFFLIFGLVLGSLAVAVFIGETYSWSLGFGIVGLFYLLMGVLIKYVFLNRIRQAVANEVIRNIFKG